MTITDSGATLGQGSVVFTDGTRTLATIAVNAQGVAICTTASLSPGSHHVQASYVSQGNYAAGSSSTLDFQVSGGGGGGGVNIFDYTIQASGLPVIIHRGETATIQLSVNSAGIAAGTVALSCGTLPDYATCSFSPALLNFNNNVQSQNVTWTIQTTAAPSGAMSRQVVKIGQGGVHGLPQVLVKP